MSGPLIACMRWMRSWPRTAEPLVVGRLNQKPCLAGRGGPCRGRCKYVPVSSMAPSMAPTPLHGPPARPLTVCVCVQPRKRRKSRSGSHRCACSGDDQRSSPTKSGARRIQGSPSPESLIHAWRGSTCRHPWRQRPLTNSVRVQPRKRKRKSRSGSLRSCDDQRSSPTTSKTRVDQGRHPPTAVQNADTADRGNLSKAGWLRLRGRERHGWRDRGYRDVLAPSPAT